MTCDHPSHDLDPEQRKMLGTAIKTVQGALWGYHPPTVFGNADYALQVVKSLGKALGEMHIHHAADGCWTAHYTITAAIWHDHLTECADIPVPATV
jgi:hypothetical protein